jgi:hypothetical protein
MRDNTPLHDLIVGVLVLGSTLLAAFVHPLWWWLTGIVGALLISSYFTGFCPVYYALGKLRGGDQSHHGGEPQHH